MLDLDVAHFLEIRIAAGNERTQLAPVVLHVRSITARWGDHPRKWNVRHNAVHVFQFDVAASLTNNRRRFNLEALQLWLVEGMAEYFSKGRIDPLTAMWIRDATIHNRMPVIIRPEDEALWLDPEVTEPEPLQPLLRPYAAGEMEASSVSTAVNRPVNDREEVLRPAA